jgi:hypothetical protein
MLSLSIVIIATVMLGAQSGLGLEMKAIVSWVFSACIDSRCTACPDFDNLCTACNDGWKGRSCNIPCRPGFHGANCLTSYECGDNCKVGHCTSDSTCSACLDGWMGPNCETACNAGWHGPDCSVQCTFLRISTFPKFICIDICAITCAADSCIGDNHCTACQEGWVGRNCQNRCLPGWSGPECAVVSGMLLDAKTVAFTLIHLLLVNPGDNTDLL